MNTVYVILVYVRGEETGAYIHGRRFYTSEEEVKKVVLETAWQEEEQFPEVLTLTI